MSADHSLEPKIVQEINLFDGPHLQKQLTSVKLKERKEPAIGSNNENSYHYQTEGGGSRANKMINVNSEHGLKDYTNDDF